MNEHAAGIRTPMHVVVVGAGYAGLITTNRFLGSLLGEERADVHVTVVNPRQDFVERIRLHQLAAGSSETVTRPLADVLHPQARVLHGTATRIDAGRRTLHVDTSTGPAELSWTHLVYAVGSVAAAPIPGAREHGLLLGDLEGAQAAVTAVSRAGSRPRILVVGGGFTGVEAASEFAEQHPSAEVTLVSAGPLLAGMRRAARSAISRRLHRLGVAVIEDVAVLELESGKAHLSDGHLLAFDACVLATAFAVPGLAAASGLVVDEHGRLVVDEALRSVSCPSIVGAGDAVAVVGPAGPRLRMACSVALPMGGHAAGALLSALRAEPPRPFTMGYSAQCLSLGRKHGYIQVVHPDESPRRLHVDGFLGARIKEAVCRRVLEAPIRESARPGAYTWKPAPLQALP